MRRSLGWSGSSRKRKNPGDDLFSRKAALSVSSALESLTSVFGMGTGVASPLESPGFMHLVDDGSDGRRTQQRRRQSIEDHFMPLGDPNLTRHADPWSGAG